MVQSCNVAAWSPPTSGGNHARPYLVILYLPGYLGAHRHYLRSIAAQYLQMCVLGGHWSLVAAAFCGEEMWGNNQVSFSFISAARSALTKSFQFDCSGKYIAGMTENRGRHSADSWELGSKYTRNASNASDAEPRWNARQLKSLTEAARAEVRGSLQQRDRDCYGHREQRTKSTQPCDLLLRYKNITASTNRSIIYGLKTSFNLLIPSTSCNVSIMCIVRVSRH